jgi:hypothetical protein
MTKITQTRLTFPSARPWLTVALLMVAAVLGGCAGSATLGDSMPASIGGLPADAPARPAVQFDYPAVHDMPPPRPAHMLDQNQQERLQQDLSRARDKQEGLNPAAKSKPRAKPKKPATTAATGTDQKP